MLTGLDSRLSALIACCCQVDPKSRCTATSGLAMLHGTAASPSVDVVALNEAIDKFDIATEVKDSVAGAIAAKPDVSADDVVSLLRKENVSVVVAHRIKKALMSAPSVAPARVVYAVTAVLAAVDAAGFGGCKDAVGKALLRVVEPLTLDVVVPVVEGVVGPGHGTSKVAQALTNPSAGPEPVRSEDAAAALKAARKARKAEKKAKQKAGWQDEVGDREAEAQRMAEDARQQSKLEADRARAERAGSAQSVPLPPPPPPAAPPLASTPPPSEDQVKRMLLLCDRVSKSQRVSSDDWQAL
jgi:hypothetical protein